LDPRAVELRRQLLERELLLLRVRELLLLLRVRELLRLRRVRKLLLRVRELLRLLRVRELLRLLRVRGDTLARPRKGAVYRAGSPGATF
jgi:hypothetical protein